MFAGEVPFREKTPARLFEQLVDFNAGCRFLIGHWARSSGASNWAGNQTQPSRQTRQCQHVKWSANVSSIAALKERARWEDEAGELLFTLVLSLTLKLTLPAPHGLLCTIAKSF